MSVLYRLASSLLRAMLIAELRRASKRLIDDGHYSGLMVQAADELERLSVDLSQHARVVCLMAKRQVRLEEALQQAKQMIVTVPGLGYAGVTGFIDAALYTDSPTLVED